MTYFFASEFSEVQYFLDVCEINTTPIQGYSKFAHKFYKLYQTMNCLRLIFLLTTGKMIQIKQISQAKLCKI